MRPRRVLWAVVAQEEPRLVARDAVRRDVGPHADRKLQRDELEGEAARQAALDGADVDAAAALKARRGG